MSRVAAHGGRRAGVHVAGQNLGGGREKVTRAGDYVALLGGRGGGAAPADCGYWC
jgi:hypothetical protein